MRGPYPLSLYAVDLRVPCRVRGVYCLAKQPGGPVVRIGRADADMRAELKASTGAYQSFWYETCLTPSETFVTECRTYHRHSETSSLEDGKHPLPPSGLQVKCPVCGQ